MKKSIRIAIVLAIGFGIAMVLMAVAIYFGYSSAYAQGGTDHEVYLLGLNIYHLHLDGSSYVGSSNGPAMGGICAIGMAAAFLLEEIVTRVRSRK